MSSRHNKKLMYLEAMIQDLLKDEVSGSANFQTFFDTERQRSFMAIDIEIPDGQEISATVMMRAVAFANKHLLNVKNISTNICRCGVSSRSYLRIEIKDY